MKIGTIQSSIIFLVALFFGQSANADWIFDKEIPIAATKAISVNNNFILVCGQKKSINILINANRNKWAKGKHKSKHVFDSGTVAEFPLIGMDDSGGDRHLTSNIFDSSYIAELMKNNHLTILVDGKNFIKISLKGSSSAITKMLNQCNIDLQNMSNSEYAKNMYNIKYSQKEEHTEKGEINSTDKEIFNSNTLTKPEDLRDPYISGKCSKYKFSDLVSDSPIFAKYRFRNVGNTGNTGTFSVEFDSIKSMYISSISGSYCNNGNTTMASVRGDQCITFGVSRSSLKHDEQRDIVREFNASLKNEIKFIRKFFEWSDVARENNVSNFSKKIKATVLGKEIYRAEWQFNVGPTRKNMHGISIPRININGAVGEQGVCNLYELVLRAQDTIPRAISHQENLLNAEAQKKAREKNKDDLFQ